MEGRGKRCSAEAGDANSGQETEIKRPRVDGQVVEMNSCYTNCAEFQRQLTTCWRDGQDFHDESIGCELLTSPFPCCILPNFIASESGGFLEKLKSELLRLKFHEKNNDLYQFHQDAQLIKVGASDIGADAVLQGLFSLSVMESYISGVEGNSSQMTLLSLILRQVVSDTCLWSDDLKKCKSRSTCSLRALFHSTCLPWLRAVTGIHLTDTIDMTCSKYEYTDTLLCHDDELEGRRIAFVYYLVPQWTHEDGGTLDLFDVDEYGQPRDIVKSLVPRNNNLVFFEVNAKSFHQVSEVLSPDKTRLSVNGWFHGPPASRPEPYKEQAPLMFAPIPAGLDNGGISHGIASSIATEARQSNLRVDMLEVLSAWVNPVYLDIGVQSRIQEQFEMDSQIELPGFLLEEQYGIVCGELEKSQSKWMTKGPPNRRCFHVADRESLPRTAKACLEFLHSEPFFRLLSHITGLELAENIIRPNLEALATTADDPIVISDESEGEGDSVQQTGLHGIERPESEIHSGPEACSTVNTIPSDSRTDEVTSSTVSPRDSDTTMSADCDKPAVKIHSTARDGNDSCTGAASCRGALYHWQPGSYTLASDSDPELGECALDTNLFFCCEGWSPDFGGMTSYIAKDEDEELLSVCPSPNALSLVYRDHDSLRFNKYLNHRATESRESSFFTITMVYKEKM